MTPQQQELIDKLTEVLDHDSRVLAAWLEGSIARGEEDEFSDIDLWISVKDKHFEEFIEQRELFAAKLGDVVSILYPKSIEQDEDVDSFQILLEEYPATLTIDVDVQKQSRDFRFTTDSSAEESKVLFDKAKIIQYQALNSKNVNSYAKQVAEDTLMRFWHRILEVKVYLDRDDVLEATEHYRLRLLDLVTVYRVLYTPEKVEWGWKDIEYDLPKDAIKTLYQLLPETTSKGMHKQIHTLATTMEKQGATLEKQLHIEVPHALIHYIKTNGLH